MPDWRVTLAVVAVLVVVADFVLGPWLLDRRRWWWRDADNEQVTGLLVLAAVVGAVGTAATMVRVTGLDASGRALFCLIPTAAALIFASKYWSRRSLRWTGVIALFLVSLLVLDIGRDELDPATRAAEELDAAAATLEALQSQAAESLGELADKRQDATDTLAEAIDVLESDNGVLADRASSVLDALDDSSEVEQALDAFESAYHPTLASVAETELAAAVTAAVAAAGAEQADPKPVDTAITHAWCIAKQEGADPTDRLKSIPCGEVQPGDTLEVALASVRLELAIYRQALLGRDEDTTAVDALTTALTEAQAEAGESDREETDIVEAFQAGGRAIFADLPWQRADFPVTLQVVGWVLLAALVLAGWRVIERRSGQQMAGPVKPSMQSAEGSTPAASAVKATSEAGAETKSATQAVTPAQAVAGGDTKPSTGSPQPAAANATARQTAVFRIALLQNLAEPAATPGADALSSITDLAELSGGTANLLTKVVAALKTIITKPGGYSVTGDVVAPADEKDQWRVLVRINDEATGNQMAVITLKGETASMACRAAGYWAAADILSRSSRNPSWARWETANAASLAAYSDAEKLSDLEDALHWDPTSGLLLCELGSRYDLEERWLDALVMYARAVTVHPRYPVTRYRMAISLGMIGADAEKCWITTPLSERERVAGQIDRACRRLGVDTTNLGDGGGLEDLPGADKVQAEMRLEALSLRLLDRLRDDTRRTQLLARALRPSERVVWWPRVMSIPWRYGLAARDEWLIRSARLLACDPLVDPLDLSKVEKRAKDPRSWWQLSYNLACFYARKKQPATALTWLETALERPGNQQMGGNWLTKDPDLKSLKGLPRFDWVVAQLSQGVEGSADG